MEKGCLLLLNPFTSDSIAVVEQDRSRLLFLFRTLFLGQGLRVPFGGQRSGLSFRRGFSVDFCLFGFKSVQWDGRHGYSFRGSAGWGLRMEVFLAAAAVFDRRE